ncbi:MAG: peptidase, partial [Variovorax sp.]
MTAQPLALTAAQLRTRCDPAQFAFDDTAGLAPPEEPFGQARATEALRLGLEVAGGGYHVFVLGQPG